MRFDQMKAIAQVAGLIIGLSIAGSLCAADTSLVIPTGSYRAPYSKASTPAETVNRFRLDATPVTQAQFASFIQQHPQWQPDKIRPLFAEQDYLKNRPAITNKTPVTYVSWFAAQAYCKAQGGRLPTTAEWEWAMSGGQKMSAKTQAKILNWYSQPTQAQLPEVGQQPANDFGVFDSYGLIWEWTLDFNAGTTSGESRGDGTTDNQFFCGGASARSADPSDYANFMRYALRNSLSARYTLANVGFRCAYDLPDPPNNNSSEPPQGTQQ
jgi:formylglycine-generating enzyme